MFSVLLIGLALSSSVAASEVVGTLTMGCQGGDGSLGGTVTGTPSSPSSGSGGGSATPFGGGVTGLGGGAVGVVALTPTITGSGQVLGAASFGDQTAASIERTAPANTGTESRPIALVTPQNTSPQTRDTVAAVMMSAWQRTATWSILLLLFLIGSGYYLYSREGQGSRRLP